MESKELTKALIDNVRYIDGFPIGSDDDIMELSDAPYYTACPNPFINDFIDKYGKKYDEANDSYNKEPFASDVSEGKNDAVYNAHSYHTKVPYKAIMRYILHYTNPGDIVLDGFSGTGMTGVASRRCGERKILNSMGYLVDENNRVTNGKECIGIFGPRYTILNDLSPAASLISYNYNSIIDKEEFSIEAKRIIDNVKKDCQWMYETEHDEDSLISSKGIINYLIWSDVFICPNCNKEIVYWDNAVNIENKSIDSNFLCDSCGINLDKKKLERAWESRYDLYLEKTIEVAKQVPVYINYSVGSKRFERRLNKKDYEIIRQISDKKIDEWIPINRMPEGDESRRNDRMGLTHVHHFYTSRNLKVLANFIKHAKDSKYYSHLIFFFQASIMRATKTNRFRFGGTGGLSGTLYIPSLIYERNVIALLEKKLSDYEKVLREETSEGKYCIVSNQSTSDYSNIKENSIDYIFTDPPFGKNLMYSELNYLWEVWLKVVTNIKSEAIMNKTQLKGVSEYQALMEASFKSYYKVLKPGRWITIEFSNTQGAVWNAIQQAIMKAGFVIADVRTLDKKQGSFKQVTTTTAMKQDLIISAYKPVDKFTKEFIIKGGTQEGVWQFINEHLRKLPIMLNNGRVEKIRERTPYVLFDRLVSYHIQHGISVPLDASEFYILLNEKFIEIDGMYFLPHQVAVYEEAKSKYDNIEQLSFIVMDEKTAIQWIRNQLEIDKKTYQELQPIYLKELHQIKHEELPELIEILEQNFLKDIDGKWYVPDLSKQVDLDKIREKSLLKDFDEYKEGSKKLKQFRTEAIRAGFKKCWKDKLYDIIVKVANRLPESVIQEDETLLMYYDNALMRIEE